MRVRMVALTLVALLAAGGAAACGTTDGTAAPEDTAAPEASAERTQHEWALAFAACMRGRGVDMPDPEENGAIALGGGPGQEHVSEAATACRAEVGEPPAGEGGPMTDEERMEQQLKKVQCLREHGVDVPDPQPGQGMAFDASWPEEALRACGMAGVAPPADR
ncbi:hypothetical protein [Catenuloplanes atrovinosus]|uniref:Secreted protein n=1 Tax=Catenuloplanes atrovinosus TaxID=137266 RepID=A0AAE3YSI9_9ACTN|nr:hypothetical protein [Catenuloplanes atrovinosus]MDR7277041.1 hypothetical protein [Catenuloplanes atrovinosus]